MKPKIILFSVLFSSVCSGQVNFSPPHAASGAVSGVNFSGVPVGQKFRNRFAECDEKNTCDGAALKHDCADDKNRNTVLLRLKGGAILYDAKMGLDADGSPYSQTTPGPQDQPKTSLRYPLSGQPSIDADRVPFVVISLGGFAESLGVQVGDVAAVVYQGKRVFAVIADEGPVCKIGEGSIQLHEMLGHEVCKSRALNGDCTSLLDVSIDRDVLYFLFPGTKHDLLPGLTPENIGTRIEALGAKAWTLLISP